MKPWQRRTCWGCGGMILDSRTALRCGDCVLSERLYGRDLTPELVRRLPPLRRTAGALHRANLVSAA